jgi:apolipoprotein N-acyltransferase
VRLAAPRFSSSAALASFGGFLVALSMPPWGWWPLAFIGIACFESALGTAPTGRQRLARGWLFGAVWLFMGMGWMWYLTAPGYLVSGALFAGFHAVAAWAAPTGSWRVIGRPAAHTLVEALRLYWPFGGVPLASLPIGQAAGPFVGVVRLGGVVLLTWFVFQIGFALAGPSPFVPAMVRRQRPNARPEFHGVAGFAAAVLIVVVAAVAPDGNGQRADGLALLPVAVVQGGGPQGTRATETSSREVHIRHLRATQSIPTEPRLSMVVWPENVIDVTEFATSLEFEEISGEAARLNAPILVGITEDTLDDDGNSAFLNAQVVVTPEGEITSRYDKVQRVPFGEYMPLRGLLDALGAPTDLVPRDAVAGTTPAVLSVPLPDNGEIDVATVISWEVFFGRRAADGIDNGGQIIINPTNGSSYTGTVLQTQQIASSRLRAVEFGRWVVQAAPTGFSAFVTPSGEVLQRTSISETRVISTTVGLATGRTWYSRLGDLPFAALALLALAGAWHVPGRAALARRRGAPPKRR